ncbi:MAG: hypothetical protein IPJ49_30965 [Candidatus Obscuribacter sp.]|nr:hypothetical protein [Candidatus Obscuribacter sp.]
MVTHPGAGVNNGTLVNAVLHPATGSLSSIGRVVRPEVVHRLDKEHKQAYHGGKDDLTHIGLSASSNKRQQDALT